MLLYDTLSGEQRELAIPADRVLTMYVCGVTPYDTAHMGHARTFLVFDILLRYLRACGATVRYCQNVTDVDDPLFERAARDGIGWRELAERQTQFMVENSAALGIIPPDYFPRASDEIPAMVAMIETLLASGFAYRGGDNVYFEIAKDPSFGRMARMGYAEMLATANQRGNNPDDPHKRDPLDFVLWQRGKPGDPVWPSPFGPGRPGWHIECSAMATRYLGPQIDIHGGGADLIFPHHPCEIVQSENATGQRPFVRFWVHAGMVKLNGEKMSKSLGNMVFVPGALRQHSAQALRRYLLTVHYRAEFDYDSSGVDRAEEAVVRMHAALAIQGGQGPAYDATPARTMFFDALDNDLDTPRALAALDGMVNDLLQAGAEGRDIAAAQATLRECAGVLGLV